MTSEELISAAAYLDEQAIRGNRVRVHVTVESPENRITVGAPGKDLVEAVEKLRKQLEKKVAD